MTRTHRRESRKLDHRTYYRVNHNKRFHHDALYAFDDPRGNHTYDRGRTEGASRGSW